MKLSIPLQSVTMSAEQYEKICDRLETAKEFIVNSKKTMELLSDAGVVFESDDKHPFFDSFEKVRVGVTDGSMDNNKKIIIRLN